MSKKLKIQVRLSRTWPEAGYAGTVPFDVVAKLTDQHDRP